MAVSLNWLYLWTSIVVIFISLHHVKGQCTAFPTTQFTQSVECPDDLNDTSVCTYICLDGYEASTLLTSTCNGTSWTVNPVSCSAVNCGTITDPAHGGSTCTGTTYNTVCTFYCNTGYTSSGTDTSTCQANGQWSVHDFTCAGDCTALPVTQNAALGSCTGATSNTGSGSECTFTCSIGYTPLTSLMSTCSGTTNTWDVDPVIYIDECTSSTSCQNGGVCTNTGGSYTCNCAGTGYSGPTCQTDIDECTSNTPCLNGGTCTNTGGSYTCDCTGIGYTGPTCQTDIDECTLSTSCQNGGVCTNTIGSYTCNCAGTGYSGPTCQTDIDECTSSTPCLNGGVCTNTGGSYTCNCAGTGYSGPTCQTAVNCGTITDPAHGGSTCTGTTYNTVCTFYCNTGYTSSGTDTSTCQANGQWSVHDFTCAACADGVYGVNCQEDCSCISGSSCNNVNGACTACGIIECDKKNIQVSLNRQGTYNIAHTDVLEIICNVNLPSNEVSVWWNAPNYSSDHVVPENGIFTLSKTDLQPEKDSGVYGCYAETRNSVGTVVGSSTASVTVDVQVPATIVEIPDSQEIEIFSSPVFTCSGHGKPLPAVTWQTISGDPISESNTVNEEDGYFMNSTLTFNSVDRNDNGIYQCVVNNGYDDVSENFTLTVLEVPDQVTIITFIATNAETIELTWEVTYDGNSDIIQCGVEYMELDDQQQPVTEWMAYGTFTEIEIQYTIQLENLAAYTYYKARINCTNSQGSSVPTETVIERTKESSPDPPRNVTLVANSESDITVIWLVPVKLNGELDYYIVYYSIFSGSNTMNKQTIGTEQTLILTGLVAYTEYEVWVTAVNTVGDQSEYSEKMITRTLEGVPDSPVISSFHNTSDSALTIEWDPPINSRGVTKRYELYLFIKSDRSDVNSHIELAEQTATYTYLFTGLLANTEYTVEIKVCNGRNCSLTEEKSAKTSEGIPSMPLNVEAMTGAKCKVCWEEPDNTNGVISHYRLEYAIDARTPPESNYETEEDSWKINTWENEPNQLCYDISEAYNLKPYSHYKVNVRAATYGGESDPSEEAAVCKTDPEAPEMIEEPSKPSNENSRSSDKTFWMQLPSVSQRNGPISCYEIIVVPAADVNTSKSPDELFPPSKVKDYDTASDTDAYVAIKLTHETLQNEVEVGAGGKTNCKKDQQRRKRTVSYEGDATNGELEPDSKYTAFLRAYVDTDGEPLYTSSAFMEPVETTKSSASTAIIIAVVLIVILLAIVIVLAVILLRHRRKNGEKKTAYGNVLRMRSYSQNKGRQNSAFINQDALYENAPTYPPIPAEQLPLVWATKHANDNDLLKKEYDDLPKSSKPVTVEASHIPENKIKNRYINILAYDQTRVKLTPIEDDPYSDYINACYVDGYKSHNKFIAAQGPKEETVNDFWRMIWEQKSLTIVMVTKCAESNREKCSQYWPDDCTTEYGDIKVTPLLKETIKLADYDIRSFSVCHLSDEEDTRTIIQLHYTSWPDFGAPKSPIGMLNFIKRARIIDQQHPSKPGPMLVHCSAGVGRTGTFIVLDAMMDQMAAEAKVDIFGFISQIRGQRNLLVQADVQYIFIYQALVEHYLYGNTEIDVNNMLIHWGKLHNRVPGTDKTGLEIEYQKLMEIPIENVVVKDAHSEHNRLKNRLVNVVPYDGNRFRLIRLLGREHSDYINASNIDGYRQKGAYVVTQGPLKDTVEDFWRLVWESRTGSIVMLCHLQENGLEKCTQYWPEDDETATYGDIAVQLKRNEDYSIYTIKTLLATDTKGGESRTIRHFHYTAWPEIGAPESGTGMIEMMGQIQKQQQNTGNLPILVHCSAGSGRSGAFCALNTVIERIKTEGIVDVFQTYKSLREQRPQIVQSVDQYNFVYKAVIDYLGSFDNYDNFK